MAYKMKGPYHYGAYKKTKSCGASVYKNTNPTYDKAFENMETAPGKTRGSSVRINPYSGERYENTPAGLEKFKSQAKAYNAKQKNKSVARVEPKKIADVKETMKTVTVAKPKTKKQKRQALVNKVKNAFLPGAGAARDIAKVGGLIKRIAGDGSKRRANEARRARKRRNPGSRR